MSLREVYLERQRRVEAFDEMLEALKGMRHHFGNPKRDEWINDEAFREAVLADMRAEAAIKKATGGAG